MSNETIAHLREELALARRAEEEALARIEQLQSAIAREQATLDEAQHLQQRIREVAISIIRFHGADPSLVDQELFVQPDTDDTAYNPSDGCQAGVSEPSRDDVEPIQLALTAGGRLPRGTSQLIIDAAEEFLFGRGEVPFSELAKHIQSRFSTPIAASTIRTALEKSPNIDRPRYGYYEAKAK